MTNDWGANGALIDDPQDARNQRISILLTK
jgi:hypothetical protein